MKFDGKVYIELNQFTEHATLIQVTQNQFDLLKQYKDNNTLRINHIATKEELTVWFNTYIDSDNMMERIIDHHINILNNKTSDIKYNVHELFQVCNNGHRYDTEIRNILNTELKEKNEKFRYLTNNGEIKVCDMTSMKPKKFRDDIQDIFTIKDYEGVDDILQPLRELRHPENAIKLLGVDTLVKLKLIRSSIEYTDDLCAKLDDELVAEEQELPYKYMELVGDLSPFYIYYAMVYNAILVKNKNLAEYYKKVWITNEINEYADIDLMSMDWGQYE